MRLIGLQRIIKLTLLISILVVISTNVFTPLLSSFILGSKTFEARSELTKSFLYVFFFFCFLSTYIGILHLFFMIAHNVRYPKTHSRYKKYAPKNSSLKIIYLFFILIIFFIGGVYFFIHLKLISFPFQLELREGNLQLTTQALLNGINPFTVTNNPIYINVYGILYNLIILPISYICGNTIQLHRLFSAIFIFFQLFIIYKIFKKSNIDYLFIIIGLLFIWLSQITLTTPLARPDSLGQLLFLISILFPFLYDFDTKSLAISIIAAVLSFQTKMYFLLGAAVMTFYLFLFISKKKALIYAGITVISIFFSILILNSLFESYFVNTLYLYAGITSRSLIHLIRQCEKFIRDYWGLFILGLGLLINSFHVNEFKWKIIFQINLLNIQKPFFMKLKLCIINFSLIFSTLTILLVLGWHSGNFQVYFYHLITPFLTIFILQRIGHIKPIKNISLILLLFTLLTQSYENLLPDLKKMDMNGWLRYERLIISSNEILNSPIGISILINNNKPIAMSGYTQYFFMHPNKDFFLYPNKDKINIVGQNYLQPIAEKIKQQQYDFIETFQNENYELLLIGERIDETQSDRNFLSSYYALQEVIELPMPHTHEEWKIGIWIPKKSD